MTTHDVPENDMPVAETLRLFLLDRLDEFAKITIRLTDPSRETLIDAVHDLRVVCRQILSLIYAFSPYVRIKRLRPIKKNITRINRVLGPVRDLDIMLTQSELSNELRTLIDQEHMNLFSELLHECTGQKLQKKLRTMRHKLVSSDADIRLAPAAVTTNGRVQMRLLGPVVPEILYRLAADVTAYRAIVGPLDSARQLTASIPSTDALHRLRISCKQFRYTVALLQPLFGKQADSLILSFKALQDVLGRLHDLQILAEIMTDHNKTAASAITDTAVFNSIQHKSTQLLEAFFTIWQPMDQTWMHQQIRLMIDTLYQTKSLRD